jgi:hypothetical protein
MVGRAGPGSSAPAGVGMASAAESPVSVGPRSGKEPARVHHSRPSSARLSRSAITPASYRSAGSAGFFTHSRRPICCFSTSRRFLAASTSHFRLRERGGDEQPQPCQGREGSLPGDGPLGGMRHRPGLRRAARRPRPATGPQPPCYPPSPLPASPAWLGPPGLPPPGWKAAKGIRSRSTRGPSVQREAAVAGARLDR